MEGGRRVFCCQARPDHNLNNCRRPCSNQYGGPPLNITHKYTFILDALNKYLHSLLRNHAPYRRLPRCLSNVHQGGSEDAQQPVPQSNPVGALPLARSCSSVRYVLQIASSGTRTLLRICECLRSEAAVGQNVDEDAQHRHYPRPRGSTREAGVGAYP